LMGRGKLIIAFKTLASPHLRTRVLIRISLKKLRLMRLETDASSVTLPPVSEKFLVF
jgi:hypothetical protein